MTPIKDYIDHYGTVYAASKSTGIHAQQLHRWIKAGAMVDSDGQVWIKAKGKLV